jgi:uncharacterized protein YbjT (DUF2867 family)
VARTAVIAGASGLVGGFCLRELLDEPAFGRVLSLGRRSLPHTHPKLTQIATSFDEFPALPSLEDAAVFCALGTTIRKSGSQEAFRRVDHDYPLRLGEICRRQGASSYALVSSVGADKNSSNFYLRVKGELEDNLRALSYPALHIFEPGFLMGERQEHRAGERIGIAVASVLQHALLGPFNKYRPILASEVGRAMVQAVLRNPSGNFTYHWAAIRALARSHST